MNEIKECPFCAYNAAEFETLTIDDHFEHRIMCLNCGAMGPNDVGNAQVIKAWNMRREAYPSVQADADAYEDLCKATPEELLEAVIWFLRQRFGTPGHADHQDWAISYLRNGFALARPGGWEQVAPMWLRESQKIAALDG